MMSMIKPAAQPFSAITVLETRRMVIRCSYDGLDDAKAGALSLLRGPF